MCIYSADDRSRHNMPCKNTLARNLLRLLYFHQWSRRPVCSPSLIRKKRGCRLKTRAAKCEMWRRTEKGASKSSTRSTSSKYHERQRPYRYQREDTYTIKGLARKHTSKRVLRAVLARGTHVVYVPVAYLLYVVCCMIHKVVTHTPGSLVESTRPYQDLLLLLCLGWANVKCSVFTLEVLQQ